MKILVPGLVIFTIWCVISVRWYVCGIHELCKETDELPDKASEQPRPAVDEVLSSSEQAPLAFQWSGATPITNEDFGDFRDSLKSGFDQSPASVIEITGIYDPQEINNSDFENLGVARAENIKQLLLTSGIKRSMRIKSRTGDLSAGLSGNIRNAYQFELVPQEEVTDGFLITEATNKLVIHFPLNSASPEGDQRVQNALKNLAKQAMNSDRNLLVVGHTDNLGESMDNMKLGLARAAIIKEMLLSYGMQENKVLEESEGEAVPLVRNTTPRGRQQNRRVEIILI